MVRPHSLCLEHAEASNDERRWLCCTTVVGGGPGLRLLENGTAAWYTEESVAAELFTTADGRVALLRRHGAVPIRLRRADRVLDVPEDKPVILLDSDRLELAGMTQIVHVHGFARESAAPFWLQPSRSGRAVALAVALGASLVGCRGASGPSSSIEVRDEPPKMAPSEDWSAPSVVRSGATPGAAPVNAADGGVPSSKE